MGDSPLTPSPDHRKTLSRGAASRANASFAEQLTPGSSTETDLGTPFALPNRVKLVTYGGKGRKPRVLPDTPTRPNGKGSQKGKEKEKEKDSKLESTVNRKRRRLSTESSSLPSEEGLANTPAKRRPLKATLSSASVLSSSPIQLFASSQRSSSQEDVWCLPQRRDPVWIFVDTSGNVRDAGEEGVWWPGTVSAAFTPVTPLQVELSGQFYPHKYVEIHIPSQDNVQHLFNPSTKLLRYTTSTFISHQPPVDDLQASPRKRQRRDKPPRTTTTTILSSSPNIIAQWESALLASMKTQVGDDDDGVPDISSALNRQVLLCAAWLKDNYQDQDSTMSSLSSLSTCGDDDDDWSPPPPDDTLVIPGELVLGRSKKTEKVYWPAQVREYVPPSNSRETPLYLLHFMDGTDHKVEREWFFTSDEPRFFDCPLGRWESEHVEVINDEDVDEPPVSTKNSQRSRSPSPITTLPLPDSLNFESLPLRQQLAYTKPILLAILAEKYPPAKKAHNDFIQGGNARQRVYKSAAARGMIGAKDVNVFQEELLLWTLRSEREVVARVVFGGKPSPSKPREVAEVVDLVSDSESIDAEPVPPSSSLRPTPESELTEIESFSTKPESPKQSQPDTQQRLKGCEAYEDLSTVEKIEYCCNVLLPEVLIQISLWRSDQRKYVELLSPEEEQRLHDAGAKLLQKTDWVTDVIRLRDLGNKKEREAALAAQQVVVGGTKSRPRRSTLSIR